MPEATGHLGCWNWCRSPHMFISPLKKQVLLLLQRVYCQPWIKLRKGSSMHIMWEDVCLLKAGLATGVVGFKVQTALWQVKADWAGDDFTW